MTDTQPTLPSDLVASVTLAQLYIGQGHRARARDTLQTVLERNPTHGHARCLLERLELGFHAALKLKPLDDSWLEVTYAAAPAGSRVLVASYYRSTPVERVRTFFTSAPCNAPTGRWEIQLQSRARVVACIGSVLPSGFVPRSDVASLELSPRITTANHFHK